MSIKHEPVLLAETITKINPQPGEVIIDVTLGRGGHFFAILERIENQGKLIGMDVDTKALDHVANQLEEIGFKQINPNKYERESMEVLLLNRNFRDLHQVMNELSLNRVDAIFADLGFATDQLDYLPGLSFLKDEKLDMRMDKTMQVTAADLLNGLYKKELVKLFEDLADIKFANRLANAIIQTRKNQPFNTTKQLVSLVQKIVPYHNRKGTNKHPEAKVFQALRIAVNDELNSLRSFLPLAFEHLSQGGKLAIISFHSGEDRIVKEFFRARVNDECATYVTRLIKSSTAEISRNPNSRSAKLRIIKKI